MASQLGKPFTPSLHTRSRDFNLSHSVCRPFHDTAPLSACQGSSGALGAQLICFQVRAALTQAARQGADRRSGMMLRRCGAQSASASRYCAASAPPLYVFRYDSLLNSKLTTCGPPRRRQRVQLHDRRPHGAARRRGCAALRRTPHL